MKKLTLPIYLDYAASTPVDPRVADVMCNYLTQNGIFGNPASTHAFGKAAKEAVEQARSEVANLIGAEASEIIWTSGATEADNLALKGAAELYQQKGRHIITVKTEHSAVLDCCQYLEKKGFQVTYLTPQKNGLIDFAEFQAALRDDTILVSIMHINNELGIIQDLAAIGKITSSRGILFHVDAAQSAGKIPIDVNAMAIDMMSLSGHKIYGPKGIGALYLRKQPRIRVAAQIHGGGHESGMRSGTLATHQIVGMGAAFTIAKNEMQKNFEHIKQLSARFWQSLSQLKNVSLNSDLEYGYPGILNICFGDKTAQDLMQQHPDLAFSAASACHSKGVEPSHVLRALGLSFYAAHCSARFSFGRFTTQEEVDFAAKLLSGGK